LDNPVSYSDTEILAGFLNKEEKALARTCNEDRCLPPQEDTVELSIAAKLN
jgi:hypothetical protein